MNNGYANLKRLSFECVWWYADNTNPSIKNPTTAIRKGASIAIVGEALDHKNPKTTIGYIGKFEMESSVKCRANGWNSENSV